MGVAQVFTLSKPRCWESLNIVQGIVNATADVVGRAAFGDGLSVERWTLVTDGCGGGAWGWHWLHGGYTTGGCCDSARYCNDNSMLLVLGTHDGSGLPEVSLCSSPEVVLLTAVVVAKFVMVEIGMSMHEQALDTDCTNSCWGSADAVAAIEAIDSMRGLSCLFLKGAGVTVV